MGQIPSRLNTLSLVVACLLFPVSGLLGGMALLYHLLWQLRWGQRIQQSVLTPIECRLLVLFILLSLGFGVFTRNPLHHYGGWLAHYGMPFAAMGLLLKRQINSILWLKALACGGIVLAIIAWGNYFRGWTLLYQWGHLPWFDRPYVLDLHLMYHFGRARGFALHPNLLGCLLAMNLPLLMAWSKTCESRYGQWLLGSGQFLTLLGLCVAFSRGAWLATGLVLFLMIFFQPQPPWKHYGIILCVFVLAIWAVGMLPLLWEHLQTLSQIDYHSNVGRLYVWASGWNMLTVYWWQGIGILHFDQIYPSYAVHSEPMAHLHSLYLQTLVESGCVAGGILLALWILLSRHRPAPLEIRPWQQGTGYALLTLLIFSWTDYPLAEGRVLFVTTVLLAIWLQWRHVSITSPGRHIHTQTD